MVWIMHRSSFLLWHSELLGDALVIMWLIVTDMLLKGRTYGSWCIWNISLITGDFHFSSASCTAAAWLVVFFFFPPFFSSHISPWQCVLLRCSLISMCWDVMRQQCFCWAGMGGWINDVSLATDPLGNRLAARLRTSPSLWPRQLRQMWEMGSAERCCRAPFKRKPGLLTSIHHTFRRHLLCRLDLVPKCPPPFFFSSREWRLFRVYN